MINIYDKEEVMGFLDDLGKSLNKVGKKTSEMASGAKLKLEITKNKSNIDKKYEALGARIYFLSKEGLAPDESIGEIIAAIDELFLAIENLENEIADITKEKNIEVDGLTCSKCGIELAEATKFCGSCGEKIEIKVELKEDVEAKEEVETIKQKLCPNCQTEIGDSKFCNSCGTSIE